MISAPFAIIQPGQDKPDSYLRAMPRKPIEFPPAVAQAFVKGMRAFSEPDAIKRDEIARAA